MDILILQLIHLLTGENYNNDYSFSSKLIDKIEIVLKISVLNGEENE